MLLRSIVLACGLLGRDGSEGPSDMPLTPGPQTAPSGTRVAASQASNTLSPCWQTVQDLGLPADCWCGRRRGKFLLHAITHHKLLTMRLARANRRDSAELTCRRWVTGSTPPPQAPRRGRRPPWSCASQTLSSLHLEQHPKMSSRQSCFACPAQRCNSVASSADRPLSRSRRAFPPEGPRCDGRGQAPRGVLLPG